MRAVEVRILSHGQLVCGAAAVVLALASALAGSVGAGVLAIQLAILTAASVAATLVMHRRLGALARYRRLDRFQRAGLLTDLRHIPTLPVTLSAPSDDLEAVAFAAELLHVLREANWPVRGVRLDSNPANAAKPGIVVVPQYGDEPPRAEAHLLLLALARAGLAPMTGVSRRLPNHDQIELVVGRRPG